jgi:hypothetical protein
MSERALRGTRLGATSYETDSGIDLAPRQDVEYACPSGHRFRMPFSVEAEVPMVWECRVCGAQALRVGGVAEEDKPAKPARTHWDMLLERRSIPELEEVLAERLDVLRHGGIGGHAARAARHAAPPVNLATGAPETDKVSAAPKATASTAAKKTTAAKKAPAKKTTAGTAPAKKTTASKPAPATKTTDKPIKKTAAKRPSAK